MQLIGLEEPLQRFEKIKMEARMLQGISSTRLSCVKLALLLVVALSSGPGIAAERVRMAAFQGTFINFPIYVAKDLGLFEKHGLTVEIIYGKGIQPTNMVISGATEFGGFAVEHG